jgi:hypothetical protein
VILAAYAMDPIRASDERHRQAMTRGSEALAKAINRLRGGDDPETEAELQWSSESGSTAPQTDSWNKQSNARAERLAVEKQAMAETRRAMRDPCPYCGVRQDIGCKHVRHLFTATDILTNIRHVDQAWEREIKLAREGK